MDPAEVEFLAEKEEIGIVPNFSQDQIHLIGGEIGPFNPGLEVRVPLWMAINLAQRQKCRIIPPEWMDVEKLSDKKQDEQDSQFFTEMPCSHYMEVSLLLLQHSTESIPRADEIRTLVKDIWDLRMAKLRSSIDVFVKSDSTHAKLNHLTLMELNTVRPLLTKALGHMHELRNHVSYGAALRSTLD
ncbi:hypothetical protein CAPTEDRAFT_162065 [Capitella teleta]|uniref:DNA replication complex GINS protein PSF2 n=1 Tax=Capitella teleta TaxID=283909 RepID=R7UAR7_CAPTE|nr:hypothetical protein CAPTEDRAFT_162065 [Capitella teleta]|eukprot:ELU03231.1 hypothetical protein CAPTEDRAFT_162065 [Capitella teleta]